MTTLSLHVSASCCFLLSPRRCSFFSRPSSALSDHTTTTNTGNRAQQACHGERWSEAARPWRAQTRKLRSPVFFTLTSVCWDTPGVKLAGSEWKYSVWWATCVKVWLSLSPLSPEDNPCRAGVCLQPALETAAVWGHIRPFLTLLLIHSTFDQTGLD